MWHMHDVSADCIGRLYAHLQRAHHDRLCHVEDALLLNILQINIVVAS